MHNLSQIKFYYNHLSNQLPPYFKSIPFSKNKDIHGIQTRYNNDLVNPKIYNDYARYIPRNSLPTLINNLNPFMKEERKRKVGGLRV